MSTSTNQAGVPAGDHDSILRTRIHSNLNTTLLTHTRRYAAASAVTCALRKTPYSPALYKAWLAYRLWRMWEWKAWKALQGKYGDQRLLRRWSFANEMRCKMFDIWLNTP